MKRLWFNPGVDHRHIGPKTPWPKKPPEAQAAIILAANKLGVDCWELVKPEYRDDYLKQARKLIAEGVQIRGEGTPGTETLVAVCSAA